MYDVAISRHSVVPKQGQSPKFYIGEPLKFVRVRGAILQRQRLRQAGKATAVQATWVLRLVEWESGSNNNVIVYCQVRKCNSNASLIAVMPRSVPLLLHPHPAVIRLLS